jgi:arsenate reductase-like glutaredoxin family protein
MKKLLFSIIFTGFCTLPASAQVYKWVDAESHVHYSDIRPPLSGKVTEKKKWGDSSSELSPLPYATKEAARKNTITLYTSATCGEPCSQAKALLNQRHVPYTIRNTDKIKTTFKNPNDKNRLPILIVGKQPAYKGFEENDWQRMLDNAGYPKSKFSESPISTSSAPAASISTSKLVANSASSYQCDGRTRCTQMKSCEEAMFFLKNCPGVKMDGDRDGTPCEEQFCER